MGWWGTDVNAISLYVQEDEMKTDCNRCGNKNCPPHVSGQVKYDCKTFKPVSQGLGSVFEQALVRNPTKVAECLTKCNLRIPLEAK